VLPNWVIFTGHVTQGLMKISSAHQHSETWIWVTRSRLHILCDPILMIISSAHSNTQSGYSWPGYICMRLDPSLIVMPSPCTMAMQTQLCHVSLKHNMLDLSMICLNASHVLHSLEVPHTLLQHSNLVAIQQILFMILLDTNVLF